MIKVKTIYFGLSHVTDFISYNPKKKGYKTKTIKVTAGSDFD